MTNEPKLYPHQQELIEQLPTGAKLLHGDGYGKTINAGAYLLQSLSAAASLASVTGRLANQHPEMQSLDNPLISGDEIVMQAFDDASDWSDIEQRMAEAFGYVGMPPQPPLYTQQLGRAKRIPMDEENEAPAKASYLAYNTSSPKGREGANNGKKAKALDKRRAANKSARKARRNGKR